MLLCYQKVLCLSVLTVCNISVLWPTSWMDQEFGMQVGPGPGHIALDGDPAPLPKGADPQFSAHIYCCQMAASIKMPLGREVSLGPHDIVLDGDPAPLPKKGAEPPRQFSAHVYIVAKLLDGSR